MSELMPCCGQKRELLYKKVPLKAPYTINIVTSTVCNFKCSYCVHSLSSLEKEKLDFYPKLMEWDIFEETVHQICSFDEKPKTIFLYGVGEPLCNPRLPEMVRYIKQRFPDVIVSFITNGVLLTEQNINELVNAGLDIIRISIQGLNEKKYLEVCDFKIDFKKFIKNILYLYENRKQCEVFVKIIDIALGEGEEELFYSTFQSISDRMYIEKCMPIFEGVEYREDIKQRGGVISDRYGNLHKPRIVCPMTFYTLSIMPDGEVRPCDNLKRAVELGNIKDTTLPEIWKGRELYHFWKLQLMNKRYDNIVCKECVAPDDVSQKEDELDNYRKLIMEKMKNES